MHSNGTRTKKESSSKTRQTIVDLLKQHGPMDVATLSQELSITGMAVRQHLYSLQGKGLVDFEEEARPMGRPAKLWRLTSEANRLFPTGYSELTVSLIDAMKESFGQSGLDKLLHVRNKKLHDQYLARMSDATDLKEKLRRLAAIRTDEGYMAEIREQEDGQFLFVEKHCPICDAAAACTQLCQNELSLFRSLLGDDVHIERTEHLLTGENRCVYKVEEKKS